MSAAAPAEVDAPTGATRYRRILLASEGRAFSPGAIARAVELGRASGAGVHVYAIARVHGVAFGLPSPGLLPTKREWAERRENVAKAIKRLERKGIEADGHVFGTRNATKAILKEAAREGCDVIVMGADADRNRFTGNMMWTQEPQRVRRRAKLPVHLVIE